MQLAKRKALELEDFGKEGDKAEEEKFDEEVTKEGVQLMEDILRTWSSTISGGGDGDVEMGDATTEGDNNEEDYEAQLNQLKAILEEYGPAIRKNTWLQDVVQNLQ